MAIVIMKNTRSVLFGRSDVPHCVWNGTMKSALEWCQKKTDNPRNLSTQYWAVRVKDMRHE